MNDIPRVVLTGGVSGGHTFPLVAVARELKRQFPDGIEFLFIGSQGRFESEAMAVEQIPVVSVQTGKWRRYFSLQNFTDLFRIPIGFLQSLWYLFRFLPDAVFAKGGSASVPVVLAARLYRIPVIIHDSDAVAGRANRFLSHFAQRIAIAYPSAHRFFPEERTALTGNPVREEILAGDVSRAAASFGLQAEKPAVLVIGGSQGARILNVACLRVVPALLEKGVQVIHQTGSENFDDVADAAEAVGIRSGERGYVAVPFMTAEGVADALALATVVVSRAGASSIAELAATRKAAILVPLGSAANDEQRMNAYDIADIGGAVVLEEGNLGEHLLLEKIEELLGNAELRTTMGQKISAFYHPDAALAIASGIRDVMVK